MKKSLTTTLAIIAAVSLSAAAVDLQFSGQTITVEPSQLSIESVAYCPDTVSTNTVLTWMDADAVYTNLYYGLQPDEVITNSVRQQVATTAIVTTPAHWVCNVEFALPRGHQWSLNGIPVTIDRFKALLNIPVSAAAVMAVFPDNYSGLSYAASNGDYQPTGSVCAAFLQMAAAVLAEGAQ